MNAPFRTLTAAQVTSGAVLERALRGAHDVEVLLSTFIGTVDSEAKHAVLTEAQRTEARELARLFLLHADTLAAVANDEFAAARHCRTLKREAVSLGEREGVK